MSRLTSEKITNLIRFVQQIPVNVNQSSSSEAREEILARQPQRNGDIFYLTTAINYTNGPPHVGHCYEGVTSDAIVRYNRMYGRETYFLTGADEHGQKIARTAEAKGMTSQELCDKNVAIFKELLSLYNISNDQYIRTTDPRHEAQCKELWLRSLAKDDIYLGSYSGWYNTREEQYVTETEAAKSGYLDPTTKQPLDRHEEASYFFKMSKYQEALISHIEANPSFIRPEKMRNQILKRLEEPLEDLCVSRSTFDWGVQVPNDPDHVMYVWFDALANYVTALDIIDDDSVLKKFWENVVHIIGVDIVWFHTVIWPCILMSCDLKLPTTVFCHGFVQDKNGDKMSKSVGNVVDPFEILEFKDEADYDSDTVRFFLMQQGTYGDSIKFDLDAMRERHDSILVNTFGNLVYRCTNLTKKFCGGAVPDADCEAEFVSSFDLNGLREEIEICFGDFNLSEAIRVTMAKISDVNGYLVQREPWKLKKQPEKQAAVIRTCLEAVYVLAHYMEPFTPRACRQIFEDFGSPPQAIRDLRADLKNLAPGAPVNVGPVLFHQIQSRFEQLVAEDGIILTEPVDGKIKKGNIKANQKKNNKKKDKKKSNKGKNNADKQPMERIEFVVGRIESVEGHPERDDLFVERIDIGEASGPIQVVSGLAKHYEADQLTGSLVVIFKNLKKGNFRGVRSEGMVMCACQADDSTVEVLRPPDGSCLGERLIWERIGEYECEPDGRVDIKKKQKAFWDNEVSPTLRTDADGIFCFDGTPFVTSAGPVRCQSADCQVS